MTDDFDTLAAAGLAARGDLFGDEQEAPKAVAPVAAPRLDGQPPFPTPGIYFGLPEEDYHAIHAISSSGLKRLSVSSMNYWADSPLNPDRDDDSKPHFDLGKAIHAFVLEGEGEYVSRFAVDLDPADYAGQPVLVSTEEIKARIIRHTQLGPVKPLGKTKQDFIDQLDALGEKHGRAVNLEGGVPDLKARIGEFMEEQPVKPVTRVPDVMEDGTEFQRPATKDDLANQLLELEPDALIWDKLCQQHRAAHEGKTFLSPTTDRRVRIAAKMILAHPEISKAVAGGYPEVSVFWHCPLTGAPKKARFDYLKMRMTVDLKSFANMMGMPIDRAIERAIANNRYNVQHVHYDEAAMMARAMIRENPQAIHVAGDLPPPLLEPYREWCSKWAKQTEAPEFLFIFQQTGLAPVTRGRVMPRGTVFSVTKSRVEALCAKWVECAATFGTDPWVDVVPIDYIDDEAIPLHATEI